MGGSGLDLLSGQGVQGLGRRFSSVVPPASFVRVSVTLDNHFGTKTVHPTAPLMQARMLRLRWDKRGGGEIMASKCGSNEPSACLVGGLSNYSATWHVTSRVGLSCWLTLSLSERKLANTCAF